MRHAHLHPLDDVVEACFRETTAIGLRTHLVEGRALARRFATIEVEGYPITVKLARRCPITVPWKHAA